MKGKFAKQEGNPQEKTSTKSAADRLWPLKDRSATISAEGGKRKRKKSHDAAELSRNSDQPGAGSEPAGPDVSATKSKKQDGNRVHASDN